MQECLNSSSSTTFPFEKYATGDWQRPPWPFCTLTHTPTTQSALLFVSTSDAVYQVGGQRAGCRRGRADGPSNCISHDCMWMTMNHRSSQGAHYVQWQAKFSSSYYYYEIFYCHWFWGQDIRQLLYIDPAMECIILFLARVVRTLNCNSV